MATEKHMDESAFGSIVREITANGELIRTHQDEKQAAIDEFNKEKQRYKMGKISKKALASSAKKVGKELKRLDALIRRDISKLVKINHQAKNFAVRQAPKRFKVTIGGVSSPSHKHHKK